MMRHRMRVGLMAACENEERPVDRRSFPHFST